MFHDDKGEKANISKSIEGPRFLKTEVGAAVRKMIRGKSVGGTDIEIIKGLEDFDNEVLTLIEHTKL